jgi:hypothetical protein
MSLTITIDRTERGFFRAAVGDDSRVIIEHAELSMLVEELKGKLDMIAVTPDGRHLFFEVETGRHAEADEDAAARANVEKTALGNAELDELIDRYPVPAEWGDEPGWSDAL